VPERFTWGGIYDFATAKVSRIRTYLDHAEALQGSLSE